MGRVGTFAGTPTDCSDLLAAVRRRDGRAQAMNSFDNGRGIPADSCANSGSHRLDPRRIATGRAIAQCLSERYPDDIRHDVGHEGRRS
jgi:hypothetical protein